PGARWLAQLLNRDMGMPGQQVHEGHAGVAVRPRHSRANTLGHERINIQAYTSLKKQDSAPVWHAGPEGRTFSKTASRSQSSRTSTTSIALPDVAPFSHSPRVREWNQARPDSCVLVHASSSM